MRRLVINGRFVEGAPTAVNAVARDLTQALGQMDSAWEVSVAVPPSQARAAEALACPVRVIGHRSGIAWEQWDLPTMRKEAVVAGFFNTVPLSGRGYVTMLHDAHVFTTPASYGRATGMWRRVLSRQAGRRGNHVVTVSDYSRQSLLAHGIATPERIGVVPNGLGPVGSVTPDAGVFERLGGEYDAPYCVALSSLLPHKNIRLLLEVFAAPELAGIHLILVGNADAQAFAKAGLNVPDTVRFAGFVSDAELAALYRGALAVCMTSTEEGFGLPALEGMALGAAALVADRGALPEVVGEAGCVLPADQAGPWRDAILQLQADPNLRARRSAAGLTQAARFTWTAAAEALLGHLERWYP